MRFNANRPKLTLLIITLISSIVGGCATKETLKIQQNMVSAASPIEVAGEFLVKNFYVMTMGPEAGQNPNSDIHVRNGKIITVGIDLPVDGAREIDAHNMQRYQNEKSIAYRSVLKTATLGGADTLQMSNQIGSLAPGKRAVIVLVRSTEINIAPIVVNPSSKLVLSAQPNNVDTVIVDGKYLPEMGN